jgi:predicted dinucleotide-binding enzyme
LSLAAIFGVSLFDGALNALGFVRARNQEVFVTWGLRNPADPKHAALPKERVKAPAEAVKEAEVVVIATPWSAAEAAIRGLGSPRG